MAEVGPPRLLGADEHLLGAEHRAPEHPPGAPALVARVPRGIEFLRDVVLVDIGQRDRLDVIDARGVQVAEHALGRERILRGDEQLNEPLELGGDEPLGDADAREPAPLELLHQRVIDREQR